MRATKIINIKKIGKLRCLDIEVDNNDHLFVANGLICSNSHSISYAANAYYYSLYPKVHFPRSFFVAQLEFMNDLDEVDGFVEDAKYFGVVTKKPDLRNGNVNFGIKNDDIIFGLSSIKGMGENSAKTLIDLFNQEFPNKDATWTNFLFRVVPHVNSGAIKAVIKAGAIDFMMEPRNKMLFELDIFLEFNQKQRTYLTNNSVDSLENAIIQMLSLGTGKFSVCANKKSAEKLQNLLKTIQNPPFSLADTYRSIAQMEQEVCGYQFSCTELDGSDMLGMASHSCEDLIKMPVSNKKIKVAGLISRVSTHKSASGEMGFVELKDSTASINFGVCFADNWANLKGLIYQNNKLIFVGNKNKSPAGTISFIIQDAHQI